MKQYYVYMLQCSDGSYYAGITNDYLARLDQHTRGADVSAYTFSRRPVQLVYLAEFSEVMQAIAWEKRIKRWTRRKKEALIAGAWDLLPAFSQAKNHTMHFSPKCIRLIRYAQRFGIRNALNSVMVRQSSP